MEDLAVQFTQNQRERDSRSFAADAPRLTADAQARQSAPGVGAQDVSGYWNGGGYAQFFALGVSVFGDGSVLG